MKTNLSDLHARMQRQKNSRIRSNDRLDPEKAGPVASFQEELLRALRKHNISAAEASASAIVAALTIGAATLLYAVAIGAQ